MAETVYATIDAIRAKITELRDKKQALDSGQVGGVVLTDPQKATLTAKIAQLISELVQELAQLKGQV